MHLRYFLLLLPAFPMPLSFHFPYVFPHGGLGPVVWQGYSALISDPGDDDLDSAMHLCEAVVVP